MRSLATFSHFEFIMISAFVVFARDSMESKTRSYLRETQKLSHYCPFFLHPNKTMIWWRRWPGRLKNSLKIWNCLVGERWTFFGSQKKRLSIKKNEHHINKMWMMNESTILTLTVQYLCRMILRKKNQLHCVLVLDVNIPSKWHDIHFYLVDSFDSFSSLYLIPYIRLSYHCVMALSKQRDRESENESGRNTRSNIQFKTIDQLLLRYK